MSSSQEKNDAKENGSPGGYGTHKKSVGGNKIIPSFFSVSWTHWSIPILLCDPDKGNRTFFGERLWG
jgi:hypothetical protein